MQKVVITRISDPMMGLAWECEPALRRVQSRFPNLVELREFMCVLVRDVADFMTPGERALPEAQGITEYNKRLAQIYLEEEPLANMPITMDGFNLFAPDRRSSLPLCRAYKAAQLADTAKADAYEHSSRRRNIHLLFSGAENAYQSVEYAVP